MLFSGPCQSSISLPLTHLFMGTSRPPLSTNSQSLVLQIITSCSGQEGSYHSDICLHSTMCTQQGFCCHTCVGPGEPECLDKPSPRTRVFGISAKGMHHWFSTRALLLPGTFGKVQKHLGGFPGSSDGKKNLLAMQEAWVQSLGREGPQEKRMATHSSILAWRIPWTEEPGGLQSLKLQKSQT